MIIWTAEIKGYDPNLAAETTLYLASAGFNSGPADTPAHQHFMGRLKQPALMRRDIFSDGRIAGRTTVGQGVVEVYNQDGALDYLVDYGFDGRTITIRVGDSDAAYPAGYTTYVFTMEQAQFTNGLITFELRDMIQKINVPLQSTKYAGTNVLPDGLEGGAELKGKPKPELYGEVFNISPVRVNPSKNIYQVRNGAVNSIGPVRDDGIVLGGSATDWERIATTATQINAIAAGGGVAIIGANSGFKRSTNNGSTWTDLTNPFPGIAGGMVLRFIYQGAIRWVVAGFDTNKVAYSTDDGLTFTVSTFLSGTVGGVDWVPVGAFGNSVALLTDEKGEMVRSTDGGVTWIDVVKPIAQDPVWSSMPVTFGNNEFLIIGSGNYAFSSTGATGTWTTGSMGVWSGATQGQRDLIFARDIYIATDRSAPEIAWSADGRQWQVRTGEASGLGIAQITDIAFAGRVFAAVQVTNEISISYDGLQYLRVKSPSPANVAVEALAYDESTGVLLGGAYDGYIVRTALAAADYATEAALLDDAQAPKPGQVKRYLAGGLFRLGRAPVGEVTCDVAQGANAAARTAGQIWKTLLDDNAGLTTGDWSAADVTALDTANSAVVGYYSTDEVKVPEVLDQTAGSVGAWWGPDKSGVFRIKRVELPSGSPVITFTANDMKRPLERVRPNDKDHGIPVWRAILRYARYWTTQTNLADGVSLERRTQLAQEWREVKVEDAAVQTKHRLSPQLIEESLLVDSAAATTELTRRQAIRVIRRDMFEFGVELNAATSVLDLFDVCALIHPRFGLSIVGGEVGSLFRIIGLQPDAEHKLLLLTVWGNVSQGRNRVTRDGIYRVTTSGDYRITRAAS